MSRTATSRIARRRATSLFAFALVIGAMVTLGRAPRLPELRGSAILETILRHEGHRLEGHA